MSILLYDLSLRIYYSAIWCASFFNKKANLWIEGRQNLFSKLENELRGKDNIVWIHCASLGEFEQGRPLIEAIKKEGKQQILLTFFSPSGYEIRKDYPQANFVYYLPLDTRQNAQRILDIVRPKQLIFVKYEIWYHLLHTAQNRGIPTILISALFRDNQFYFRWYGKAFLKVIGGFQQIFVQDEASQKVLQNQGIENALVAGDTRVDRVLHIARQAEVIPLVDAFVQTPKVLIAGSTWQQDEAILIPFIHQLKKSDWQFIIAPHEVDKNHIEAICQQLNVPFICYSKANFQNIRDKKVLIIDNIGLLSRLYQYAQVAYIGGGFGAGIHNILEPIVFGIPVIFGPNYRKFSEARTLVAQQGGFSIKNKSDLELIFTKLEQTDFYKKTVTINRAFIQKNKGATEVIYETLMQKETRDS